MQRTRRKSRPSLSLGHLKTQLKRTKAEILKLKKAASIQLKKLIAQHKIKHAKALKGAFQKGFEAALKSQFSSIEREFKKHLAKATKEFAKKQEQKGKEVLRKLVGSSKSSVKRKAKSSKKHHVKAKKRLSHRSHHKTNGHRPMTRSHSWFNHSGLSS